MKKISVIISSLIVLTACNGGASADKSADTTVAGGILKNAPAAATAYTAGATLIANNDCSTCHELNQKSTGPAFTQIAHHYEFDTANVENLSYKIIKGGTGTWGVVQMTPHPGTSAPEAKEMARYILSLRNTQ